LKALHESETFLRKKVEAFEAAEVKALIEAHFPAKKRMLDFPAKNGGHRRPLFSRHKIVGLQSSSISRQKWWLSSRFFSRQKSGNHVSNWSTVLTGQQVLTTCQCPISVDWIRGVSISLKMR
jgi:hypothetical protein